MPATVEPQALFVTPANSSGARLLRVSLQASSQTGAGCDPSAGQWQMKRGERMAAVKILALPTSNNAVASTVENVSGSGARRKAIRHTQRYALRSVNVRQKAANLHNA